MILKMLAMSAVVFSLLMIPVLPTQANTANVLIQSLVSQVLSLNLHHGISNSLDAKLQSAIKVVNDISVNNNIGAIGSLHAFVSAVEAQSGKSIPSQDADILIGLANTIIVQLEYYFDGKCPYCGGYPCIPPCDGTGPSGGGI
jgi:hypothetical protein